MTTFGVNKNADRTSTAFDDYFASTTSFVGSRRILTDIAVIRSNYGSVWDSLEHKEREQLVDETIIKPEAVIRYQNTEHGPLPYGTRQVYPRLKHPTGQKTNLIEDTSGSQGEDLDSASSSGICTYSYQDEHSAPFSWRTRSQQDLAFEFGRPPSLTSDDLNNDLELVSASPSKVLTKNHSMLARYSKGNPSYAKPVEIPIVPTVIPKPNLEPGKPDAHGVPPEQINNFVYESSPNRIVLDFGGLSVENESRNGSDDVESSRTNSPESESNRSTKGLISKVRTLTRSGKKKCSTLDLRRKSHQSPDSNSSTGKSSTLKLLRKASNDQNIENKSKLDTRHSISTSSILASDKKIIKPSVAPPPPPPAAPTSTSRPPPPERTVSQLSRTNEEVTKGDQEHPDILKEGSPVAKSRDSGALEDFKIDLKTDAEIPKTGFDFLDDW